MSALVLALRLGPRDRVSDALCREADRLGVASMALLAMTAEELRRLRHAERERRLAAIRETPAERAAYSRALLAALQRSPRR